MKTLVLNIGLNVGRVEPIDQLVDTIKGVDHQFYIDNLKLSESEGDWGVERVIVVQTRVIALSKVFLSYLCRSLKQDAIAYTLDGVGGIVFNEDYKGERFKFNPKYFINF